MHLVAGFESKIGAHGGAFAFVDAAHDASVVVDGAALARRSADRGIHVDRINGFDLPEHVLGALDRTVEIGDGRLSPGQTALVIAATADEEKMTNIARAAALPATGALWVQLVLMD